MFAWTYASPFKPRTAKSLAIRSRVGAVAFGGAAAIVVQELIISAPYEGKLWALISTATAATLAFAIGGAIKLRAGSRRVAVVGVNDHGRAVAKNLAANPGRNISLVGVFDDKPGRDFGEPAESPGSLEDLIERSTQHRVDAVVLAGYGDQCDQVARCQAALSSLGATIYVAAQPPGTPSKLSKINRLGPVPVIRVGGRPLSGWQTFQKSLVDWILGMILLVVLLPVLTLIAISVKLDSPGPALFRQPRLGLNSRIFIMFKFRTMYHHTADLMADRQTTLGDPRVTRVGRVLRKTSLDELPQLINVLRGEMSLVGPRPHAPNTKAGGVLFHEAVANYAQRHRVKPGITGWAQVNGWRGETRTFAQLEQRVAHDLHYIDNWSLRFDLKIMALTALRELNSKVAF